MEKLKNPNSVHESWAFGRNTSDNQNTFQVHSEHEEEDEIYSLDDDFTNETDIPATIDLIEVSSRPTNQSLDSKGKKTQSGNDFVVYKSSCEIQKSTKSLSYEGAMDENKKLVMNCDHNQEKKNIVFEKHDTKMCIQHEKLLHHEKEITTLQIPPSSIRNKLDEKNKMKVQEDLETNCQNPNVNMCNNKKTKIHNESNVRSHKLDKSFTNSNGTEIDCNSNYRVIDKSKSRNCERNVTIVDKKKSILPTTTNTTNIDIHPLQHFPYKSKETKTFHQIVQNINSEHKNDESKIQILKQKKTKISKFDGKHKKTKSLQFASTSKSNSTANTNTNNTISYRTIEKLSKPKILNAYPNSISNMQYAKLSDEENCTFQPFLSNNKMKANCESNERNHCQKRKETLVPFTDFLTRMESMENERHRKIQLENQRLMYKSKIHKMKCPNCGQEQSFEEMINNKLDCSNEKCHKYHRSSILSIHSKEQKQSNGHTSSNECTHNKENQIINAKTQFQYCRPVAFQWDRFHKRMEQSTQRKYENMAKIKNERQQMREMTRMHKSKRQKQLLEHIRNRQEREGGTSFIKRISNICTSKTEKIRKLEEEKQLMIDKVCTFQPKLNIPPKFLQSRTFNIQTKTTTSMEKKKKNNNIPTKMKKKRMREKSKNKTKNKMFERSNKKVHNMKQSTCKRSKEIRDKTKGKTKRAPMLQINTSKHQSLAAKFEKLLL